MEFWSSPVFDGARYLFYAVKLCGVLPGYLFFNLIGDTLELSLDDLFRARPG
jgi:hypothetical protein